MQNKQIRQEVDRIRALSQEQFDRELDVLFEESKSSNERDNYKLAFFVGAATEPQIYFFIKNKFILDQKKRYGEREYKKVPDLQLALLKLFWERRNYAKKFGIPISEANSLPDYKALTQNILKEAGRREETDYSDIPLTLLIEEIVRRNQKESTPKEFSYRA